MIILHLHLQPQFKNEKKNELFQIYFRKGKDEIHWTHSQEKNIGTFNVQEPF